MEIENNNLNLDVKLSLKEVRVMEYALRKAKDIDGIDILLSNIDDIICDFSRILNENWVSPIKDKEPEPITIPPKETIEIMQ